MSNVFFSLLIYFIIIISYIWATIFFFKANSKDALQSRKIYSCLVMPSILIQLYCIFNITKQTLLQMILGTIIFLLSLLIFWSSVYVNWKNRLNYAFCASSTLTQTGPYKYIRHPFYSSYMLTWIGGFIISGNIISSIVIFPLLLYYYKAAKREEKYFLNSLLAKEYSFYIHSTGMFFPKIINNR